jgi:U3 small nucleolar RNA-associated protein 18
MQVANAQFLGTSSEVVVSGRKPYFYVYDTHSGAMAKVPGPVGRDVKSLEDMTVSPDGEKLAFRGAAGHIHICSGRSKSWLMDVKMNSSAKSIAFLDETSMVSSGLDADIYLWDLRMNGRCVAR